MAVKTKIAISIDSKILNKVDKLVSKQIFHSRSHAIETAIEK